MSRWSTYDCIPVLPRAPGVYAIYLDGRLAYIGQTVDLRNRLAEHRLRDGYAKNVHTEWGTFKTLVLKISLSRGYGDWAMRELRLIRRLRPWANRRGLGRKARAA